MFSKSLVIAAVGFATSVAPYESVGSPVVFQTVPGTPYYWGPQDDTVSGPLPAHALNITQPSTQSGTPITTLSVYQWFSDPTTSSTPTFLEWRNGGSIQYAVVPIGDFYQFNITGPGANPGNYRAPRIYSNGAQVDSGATWASRVTVGWVTGFGAFRRDYTTVQFVNGQLVFGTGSNPDDIVAGLKITMPDGVHYGFMRAKWTNAATYNRIGRYDIVQWGYESNPGTAISVPCGSAADVNFDGVVDFFDYLDFVDVFSAGAASADFNRDGVIDFFDYLDFVALMSMGC